MWKMLRHCIDKPLHSTLFTSIRKREIFFGRSLNPTRMSGRWKATLITNPDSFEVGRLIGSYGFMNITSYSGLQSESSGLNIIRSTEDFTGPFRVQDVGEGNVRISISGSCFPGFMKVE